MFTRCEHCGNLTETLHLKCKTCGGDKSSTCIKDYEVEIDRLRSELAAMEEKCRTAEWSRNHERADNGALRNELAEAKARIAELEDAGKELHRCLVAMVDRWEPDTEGLDRVMWGNACEALGRDIWAHLKTT